MNDAAMSYLNGSGFSEQSPDERKSAFCCLAAREGANDELSRPLELSDIVCAIAGDLNT